MGAHFPIGIYAIPEISMVGAPEHELTQRKVPYETGSLTELALRQQEGEPDPPSSALDAILKARRADFTGKFANSRVRL